MPDERLKNEADTLTCPNRGPSRNGHNKALEIGSSIVKSIMPPVKENPSALRALNQFKSPRRYRYPEFAVCANPEHSLRRNGRQVPGILGTNLMRTPKMAHPRMYTRIFGEIE
jgi:hypothetical protein